MRAGGGLFLLLLIGIGFYLYLSASHTQKVIKVSQPARDTAIEVSGIGMKDSFDLDTVEKNGKITALKVVRLAKFGPLAQMYDIKTGDEITDIGPFSIRDTDPEMMRAQLLESGAHHPLITVLRAGQKLNLPYRGVAADPKDRNAGGNLNPTNGVP